MENAPERQDGRWKAAAVLQEREWVEAADGEGRICIEKHMGGKINPA